jgi:hypothetical protein
VKWRIWSRFCSHHASEFVVRTRLDPKIENPELKTFKGNPVPTVLADRGAYIAAALTVCRAYIVASRPHLAPRLASFEGWSDTVRSAFIWLGKHDPISSMGASRAEDPERTPLRALLTAWVHAFVNLGRMSPRVGRGPSTEESAVL